MSLLPPAPENLHPWLKEPLDLVKRVESRLHRYQTRTITTFHSAFIDNRQDYNDNFTHAFARVVYFHNPGLEPGQYRDIIPKIKKTATAVFLVHAKLVRDNANSWQRSLHSFVYSGLQELISQEGGYEVWATKSDVERDARYLHFYNLGPSQMAKGMYQCLRGYVDLTEIHINQSGARLKWARFIQQCFLFLCRNQYRERIMNFHPEVLADLDAARSRNRDEDRARDLVYNLFRSYPKTRHAALNLRTVDVPVVPTGGTGMHVRRRMARLDDEEEDQTFEFISFNLQSGILDWKHIQPNLDLHRRSYLKPRPLRPNKHRSCLNAQHLARHTAAERTGCRVLFSLWPVATLPPHLLPLPNPYPIPGTDISLDFGPHGEALEPNAVEAILTSIIANVTSQPSPHDRFPEQEIYRQGGIEVKIKASVSFHYLAYDMSYGDVTIAIRGILVKMTQEGVWAWEVIILSTEVDEPLGIVFIARDET